MEENQEEQEPLGKYGMMAMSYLRETNQQRYTEMFINGELMQIMRKVNEEANELLDNIMEQKLKIDPVPDPMNAYESYKHRDMIKREAEEIVLKEIVYRIR
ncbi:TnpV protein [Sedimentibacter sp.]|uniref:TnpV protein n=1 Tax=Sedimentibacter sp. TaxID=1960295 RepID=UPI0039917F29